MPTMTIINNTDYRVYLPVCASTPYRRTLGPCSMKDYTSEPVVLYMFLYRGEESVCIYNPDPEEAVDNRVSVDVRDVMRQISWSTNQRDPVKTFTINVNEQPLVKNAARSN